MSRCTHLEMGKPEGHIVQGIAEDANALQERGKNNILGKGIGDVYLSYLFRVQTPRRHIRGGASSSYWVSRAHGCQ